MSQRILKCIEVSRNDPGCFGNADLRWRAVFDHPTMGRLSIPFETLNEAQHCFNYVKTHGVMKHLNGTNLQSAHPTRYLDMVQSALEPS